MKKRKIIFAVLALLWMGIIFSFSARNGEQSSSDSNKVGTVLGKLLIPQFTEWTDKMQVEFAVKIDHIVRKTAHVTEYAVLGFLLAQAFMEDKAKLLFRIIMPWCIGALYAATDEIHQLFIPGRSGQISDVLLDSVGVLIGVMVVNIWDKLKSRSKL